MARESTGSLVTRISKAPFSSLISTLDKNRVTGPISVFLCTNLGNGPAGTQPCPAPPATISGTITAVDVTNLANERGISAGEFDELLAAIRAGATYVNVHSTRWPGGEIRSQIDGNSGHEPLRRIRHKFLAPSARGLDLSCVRSLTALAIHSTHPAVSPLRNQP